MFLPPFQRLTLLGHRGQRYPVHPLDLTMVSRQVGAGGRNYTACVASMDGLDGWESNEFEVSLGDAFLRNVYTV